MGPFNATEWKLIIAALLAVSPSGGGSDAYTLARKVSAVSGIALANIDDGFVCHLQQTASGEVWS